MSSGPRGEEPIVLNEHMRLHYLRLLRLHGCKPRCDRCREAQGVLIAAGVPINPDRAPAIWEPMEVLIAVGMLLFALSCVFLTGGRR
jgi:hypothetical protein